MNHNLQDMLDLCVKRKDKKWDNVLIIDGKERCGKSQLAKTIGYYYAEKIGKKFDINNIFFDPEEMLQYAVDHTEQTIIWDECALGGLSTQWQNQIQQKLNSMLMMTGKYRHFYIFIIPSFFRLNRYLAVDRSIGLIHVFSPDLLTRGRFLCLSESQKTWIYNNNRKSETFGKNWAFDGSFTLKNTENLVDEKEYEAKKDRAIKGWMQKHQDKKDQKLHKLQYQIATKLDVDSAADLFDKAPKTIREWRNNGAMWGFDPQKPEK